MIKRALRCLIVDIYQRNIRPVLPATCRFDPTCSEYALQAIEKYGLCQGLGKTVTRILSCHPFSRRPAHYPLE